MEKIRWLLIGFLIAALVVSVFWYVLFYDQPRPMIGNSLIQEHPHNQSVTITFDVTNIGGSGWAWIEVILKDSKGMEIQTLKIHLEKDEKRSMGISFTDVSEVLEFGFYVPKTSKYG